MPWRPDISVEHFPVNIDRQIDIAQYCYASKERYLNLLFIRAAVSDVCKIYCDGFKFWPENENPENIFICMKHTHTYSEWGICIACGCVCVCVCKYWTVWGRVWSGPKWILFLHVGLYVHCVYTFSTHPHAFYYKLYVFKWLDGKAFRHITGKALIFHISFNTHNLFGIMKQTWTLY